MTDRDLSPDAAHALALALKPREDAAAALRRLWREMFAACKPLRDWIEKILTR